MLVIFTLATSKQLLELLFRRVGTAAHPCRCVPTVEDFFVCGYDHASSTVYGAICRGTISVNLEVTMTYFLNGSLGFFEFDDLRHRLVRWFHVDGGWGWAVPRGWEPRFAGLVLREQNEFT